MVLSFEQAGELLDRMAEEFPPEFYDELNGGICLLPEAKHDPEFPEGELYIMGEYRNSGMMGKFINLDWEEELYGTLAHEFTHHMEGRAGERGLEIQDEAFLEQYREGRAQD